MVPPDWGSIRELGRPIWDTLNIATLGTVMAIILAVPVAYCAARNTTPSVAFVRPVALFIIVSSRSINSLIWALMLVTIIGPGVFAGILRSGCARSASAPSCCTRRSRRSTRARSRRCARPAQAARR